MDSIPLEIPQKQCGTCQQWFPATGDFFVRDKSKKDGFYSKCKPCLKTYRQQYYATHKAYVNEHVRSYVETHKEQTSERKKRWHIDNRERRLNDMGTYSASHREEHNAWMRRYRQTDKGKLARRTNEHRRRTYKRANQGKHTAQQLQEQFQRQKSKCYYCHKKLDSIWHADHIVPLVKGGSDDISNIVIACSFCNQSKGSKLPHEWRQGGRLF